MRENRTYGSEGGEGRTLPDPYLLCLLSSTETHHLVSPANVGRGGVDAMIVQRWERSLETSVIML